MAPSPKHILLFFFGFLIILSANGSRELEEFYAQITDILSEASGNEGIVPLHPVQVQGK